MLFRRAALTASALLLCAAPTASADTTPGVELELSVTTASGYTYSTDLVCQPRDFFADSWMACDALKQSKGNLDNLPQQDWRACTKEYDPVTFRASGHYRDRMVDWSRTFGNECDGHRQTGGLFDF